MKFDFELADDIVWQIDLLNEVFRRLEVAPLFDNTDFIVNEESAGTGILDITLETKHRDIIPVGMFLEMEIFRLEVDYTDHSFSWLLDDLIKFKEEVINLIIKLFTSRIMIEHYTFRSNLYLLDANEEVLDRFVIRDFSFLHSLWKGQRKVKLFEPIYSKPPSESV